MLVERVEAGHVPAVALVDLVAVLRIVQEEREVVEEIEHVVRPVGVHGDELVVVGPPAPIEIHVGALRAATFVCIDRVEASDESRPHRASWDLA